MTETYTLMNLQGRLGCKFQVGYFFSPDPQRASQKEAWPANVQDNLERLKDAGVPVDKGVPLCNNCNGKPKWRYLLLTGLTLSRARS